MFSNRHAPGRDELRPGVAPVLLGERCSQRIGTSSLLPGVGAN